MRRRSIVAFTIGACRLLPWPASGGRNFTQAVRRPISLSVDAEIEVPSPVSLEVQMTGESRAN